MIGLSLEGGGLRGSYQVGAYYALKKCHIKFDGYVGTSIGACNAAMLASGHDKELLDFWQNIDVEKLFDIKSFNLKKNDPKESISSYIKIIKNQGIDTTKFLNTLKSYINVNDLYNSKKDFGLVTFKLKDLQPLYLFKNDIPKNKIAEYILASCYLPVFKQNKIIDNSFYLDGGFYDKSPVNMLINRGYKKIYVVRLNGPGITQKPKDGCELIYINPSKKLGKVLEFDQNVIKNNIKMGYYDTIRQLKKLDGFKYVFKYRNFYYYKILSRKIPNDIIKKNMVFFRTDDIKDLTIKVMEYILEKNKIDYYNIYNPYKVIKKLKQNNKHSFVYEYLNNIRLI